MRNTMWIISTILLFPPVAAAADLTKIERSIRKEPVYQSKTPRYCLLVFGPEARARVWLVLDGKRLFVDRNGNGDLTDDGEPVASKKGFEQYGPDGQFYFEAGDILDGPRTHKDLLLTVTNFAADSLWRSDKLKKWIREAPEGRGYSLQLTVDWRGYLKDQIRAAQTVGPWDDFGMLVFADKPGNAPILHLGGPLRIVCEEKGKLIVGREKELTLKITTTGLGAGTTAGFSYTSIPETTVPRVEITYPPEKPGEPPLKRHYELKERC
jgi:hypothetical protein